MILLSIILVCILIIVLSIFVRPEHFNNVPTDVLTKSAKQSVEQINDKTYGNICRVGINTGKFVEMRSRKRPIDWYQNPDKKQSCSIDVAGDDLDNDITNCSKSNANLFFPQIVKDIYVDDSLDGAKRCVIDFREPEKITKTEMTDYLMNLQSYRAVDSEIFNKEELKKHMLMTKEQEAALDVATNNYITEAKKQETAMNTLYKTKIDMQTSLTKVMEQRSMRELAEMNAKTAQSKAEREKWQRETENIVKREEQVLADAQKKQDAYKKQLMTASGQLEIYKKTRTDLQSVVDALKKPVDCEVSDWGTWSQCDKPCGTGKRYRQRKVITTPQNGPVCPSLHEEQPCNVLPCPVNCQVSEWGPCSKPCGGGTQQRSVVVPAQSGGEPCPNLSRSCNTDACANPVDCLGEWVLNKGCTVPCGGGAQEYRYSIKAPAKNGGRQCPEVEGAIKREACNTQPCAPSSTCNTSACCKVINDYIKKGWAYNSTNFGECKGCPQVSNPNKIPGC